nr:hypothetical protein [Tanacetum cinerariifolium]
MDWNALQDLFCSFSPLKIDFYGLEYSHAIYPIRRIGLHWIRRIEQVSFVVFSECRHGYTVSSLMDMAYASLDFCSRQHELRRNHGLFDNEDSIIVSSNETTKDLWDALERQMRSSEYGEQDRKAAILYEYKTFKAIEGEQLLDTYLRYLKVINDLKMRGLRKTTSANKKQEFVKMNDKKVEKKADEKKRDMRRVKCYNCKNEGHFAKDCKKAKVKDYEYYKTKMLLAKKDKDEQRLAHRLLMKRFLSESEYETLDYYDNTTAYGIFVNDNDDQEIFHDCENFPEYLIESHIDHNESAIDHNDSEEIDKLIRKLNKKIAKCLKRIEKANQQNKNFENQNKDLQDKYDVLKNQATTFDMKNKELKEQLKVLIEKNNDFLAQMKVLKDQLQVKHVVIDTHVECQEKYAKLEAERYEYKIRYSAYFNNDKQHRKQIANQEVLYDKMSVQLVELDKHVRDLKNTVLEKDFKISKLEECVRNKDLEIEKCLERFENPSYFEKEKDLRPSLYDEKVIGLEYTLMFLTHSDEALEIKKFKRARENKINKLSSLKPYVPTVILEKIIIDLEDEVVGLLEKEKENLKTIESLKSNDVETDLDTFSSVIWKKKGSSNTSNVDLSYTSSAYDCDDAMNVSCNSRLYDSFDENNLFIFDDVSVRNSLVGKMSFRKRPHDSMNVRSRSNSNKSLPRTVHRWLPKMQPLAKPVAKWIPKVKHQIDKISKTPNSRTIDSGCSKHMTGNHTLLTNFMEKFLGTVRFGNNDFAVIAGYGDVGLKVAFLKSTCFVRNEDGVDLLTGDRSSNLYTISLNEVTSNSLTCLLAKASSSQSWLWHQRLSYLNFTTINNLVKNNIVQGLPKMKFKKDHLCSACEQGKIHRKHHKSKTAFASNKPLYLLHMDLCGPMRVEKEVRVSSSNTQSISNNMIPNVDEASTSHNVFNERLENAYFDASTSFHDPCNVHTFYQPYPHEKKWTKDHPLHKIIGDPKSSVRTRGQLANLCLFSCLLSSIEPDNVAEALRDADWISAMQEELDKFARLKEEVYVGQPPGFVIKQYPDHVYALDKALYGLKQAPRAWYDVLSQFLIDSGFQKDADHAGCYLDQKSTSGSVQFLGNKLVCWSSKKQNYVSISIVESEYDVVSSCCAQVLWMRTQLMDYGFFYDKVLISCDSKSAIAISCNPVQHTRTKHIVVRTGIDLPRSLPSHLGKLGLGGDYPFDLSKPLPLITRGNRQSVPVEFFINNDLKYLQGGILTMTYTTSTTKTKAVQYDLPAIEYMNWLTNLSGDDVANFAIALRMFTKSLVIQNQNRRDLPRDIPLDSVVVLRYEKRSKSENKGKVSIEMELVLEKTQQGSIYEVSKSQDHKMERLQDDAKRLCLVNDLKKLQDHIHALTKEIKEMKAIFRQLEAEVDQNVVNRKHDKIEQKNLLIANDNLIADCLSKEVFFIATNSKLTISRFTKMHDDYTVVQEHCLELKAELFKLTDKIQKDDHNELVKCFSNLEVNHLNLQLKHQQLKESFGNNKSLPARDTPDFDSVFVIEKMKASIQGMTMKCITIDSVTSKVLAPGMYVIDVAPLPPRYRNNRKVHLDYLKHLKESVATLREIVEEARAVRPLDRSLAFACHYTKHSQELLEYAVGTCPKGFNKRHNKHASTPLTRNKQVTFEDQCE